MFKQRVIAFLGTLLLFTGACGKASGNQAASVAEEYLRTLVAKDSDRLAALSCADWEPNARLEVDSFQAVDVRLEGLACQETAREEDGTALVVCSGKIIATYNNEDQEIDLSLRTYQVVQQGGEYLVCGYR